MAEVHVTGLAELQKFLDQLPVKMEKNVMRGALRRAAIVVRTAAKANVHSVSGELSRSIGISTNTKRGTVIAKVMAGIGFGKKGTPPRNLPLWVEYGTKQHWIKVKESARPGRMMRGRGGRAGEFRIFSIRTLNRMLERVSLMIGKNFVGQSLAHPGARAKPFLRPALDSQAQNAVIAAAEYIKGRLESKHGLDTADITIGGDS